MHLHMKLLSARLAVVVVSHTAGIHSVDDFDEMVDGYVSLSGYFFPMVCIDMLSNSCLFLFALFSPKKKISPSHHIPFILNWSGAFVW